MAPIGEREVPLKLVLRDPIHGQATSLSGRIPDQGFSNYSLNHYGGSNHAPVIQWPLESGTLGGVQFIFQRAKMLKNYSLVDFCCI